MKEPQTSEEWQTAFDAASACRMIHDCKLYGLIEGGPSFDVKRIDWILDEGERRGLRTSRPPVDLAIEMMTEINAGVETRSGNSAANQVR